MKISKQKILFLILFKSLMMFSQPDTLNKLNDKGAKVGYWKTYYNSKLDKIQDTTNAKYKGFESYVNGVLFRGIDWKKEAGKHKISYVPTDNLTEKKVVLNGTVSYYDKYNLLVYKDEFFKGIITKSYAYSYFKDGSIWTLYHEESYDYSKRYNNENSFYFEKKDYKVLRDKWVTTKGYLIYLKNGKTKKIKY